MKQQKADMDWIQWRRRHPERGVIMRVDTVSKAHATEDGKRTLCGRDIPGAWEAHVTPADPWIARCMRCHKSSNA